MKKLFCLFCCLTIALSSFGQTKKELVKQNTALRDSIARLWPIINQQTQDIETLRGTITKIQSMISELVSNLPPERDIQKGISATQYPENTSLSAIPFQSSASSKSQNNVTQCHAIKADGTRCDRMTSNSNGYCWQHQNKTYTPSTIRGSSGTVHVKGYYRKDGTYVRPHTRSAPRKRY